MGFNSGFKGLSLQYKYGDDTKLLDKPNKFSVPVESETEQFCKFQLLNKALKPLSINENLLAPEKTARALPYTLYRRSDRKISVSSKLMYITG